MAITVEQQPASIALARNPMWVKLETDNYVISSGTKASIELVFSGNPAAAGEITLGWPALDLLAGEFDMTFVATYTLDNSGRQIPTNVNADALLTYINTYVVPALLSNYYIARDFDISVTGTSPVTVKLTAKEDGDEYSLDPATDTVTNMTLANNTAGDDVETQLHFQFLLGIYLEQTYGSGTYTPIIELEGDPDDEYQAEWNIADIILAYLSPDLPEIGDGATLCSNILKRYYVRYAENYGSTQEVHFFGNTALSPLKALMAGVRFDAFPASTFLADHITAATGRRFLTTAPRSPLSALASQKLWLYYYNELTTGTLTIRATIYYTDSSSTTEDIEVIASPQAGVYWLPAGHTQLSLDDYAPTKTILSWDIWVEHSGGHTSEVISYTLDRRRHQHVKYFLFQNSAGGMDTVCCTGEQEERLEVKAEPVEKYVGNGYAGSDAQLAEDENEYTDVYSVATGLKTADYIRYLRDLMLSAHVYEITDDGLRRIILDRDKMALVNTEDDTFGLVLVYRYAYENKAYSA